MKQTSCEPKSNLRRRELGERQFFCRIVKENYFERIAGIVRANQVRHCERHLLRGRKTILAVENH